MAQPEDIKTQAKKAMDVMTTAAVTLREAISSSLPVANNQLLTVQIPGTVINYADYFYEQDKVAFAPLNVRVNEARLVDGMLSLSKVTLGKTGKSVARSYLSALDLLIPVEASVSGLIASPSDKPVEGRRKIIKDHHDGAMKYLTSLEEDPHGNTLPNSKLSKYVEKQESWAKTVELYSIAQERQQKIFTTQYANDVNRQKEAFLQWIQAHSRDFKAAIQARYMDWVVHGYKFKVEFNFGIVDISSGMKRVEASKEAYRNLVIIGEDGFTEYNQVKLEPSNWASIVRDKVLQWNTDHLQPTSTEIKAEIKRLQNLRLSHQAMLKSVEAGTFNGAPPQDVKDADNDALQKAYSSTYSGLQSRAKALTDGKADSDEDLLKELAQAQVNWRNAHLKKNKEAVDKMSGDQKSELTAYLDSRVKIIDQEIEELTKKLPTVNVFAPMIIGETGAPIDPSDLKKNSSLLQPPLSAEAKEDPASRWTRITAKVSSSKSDSTQVSEDSASGFAAKAGFGLFSASGGASHTNASTEAMSSMSSLDVEVSMDCLLVSIERPWLHGELFVDSDLDVGNDFRLSPGEDELLGLVKENRVPEPDYQQFSSYPTAFVVAASVELSFSGDTSNLEGALQASSTEANVSVGWGPFGVSASHKQSSSKNKTRTESTATGMKISLQAPQIIAWVQTLLPKLPRDPTAKSRMEGLLIESKKPSGPQQAKKPSQSEQSKTQVTA